MLSQYPHVGCATPVQCLGAAGGFSGAQLWKLASPQGDLCLRGWPPGATDPARLGWIHHHLSRIVQAGCALVPSALATREGPTCVAYDGRWWDLSPWLSGSADFDRSPTRAKLVAALQALAHFHRSARGAVSGRPVVGASPALAHRLALFQELDRGLWQRLDQAARSQTHVELRERARLMLEHYRQHAPGVLPQVRAAQRLCAPLQICHGDLWHDHVLFRGEEVTGLIDFGAMKVDSRAIDVARLLGSLVGSDAMLWQAGLAAYEQVELLADADRGLIAVLDQSTILLSGMNWLKWLLLERRQFEDRDRVLCRLDGIITRLTAAGHDR